MKRKRGFILLSAIAILFFMLSGCVQNKPAKMVNEVSFSTIGINEITISYDDEDITFYESSSDDFILKEYMSKDKTSYHANISRSSDSIKISEGTKPLFKDSFIRYIEVYLPSSYHQSLKVTSTDGNITISEIALNLDNLGIDCTSGNVVLKEVESSSICLSSTSGRLELGRLIAEQIKIDTTKGNVVCERVEGNVSYTSTSGDAHFLSAVGSGTFKANNSGNLSVRYDEVSGNLSFFNKNDMVKLALPADLSFEFEATTKNGAIETNFEDELSIKGNMMSGTVGINPSVRITVETKNGDIEVSK